MKCKNCNREMEGNSRFCIYCGSRIEADEAAESVVAVGGETCEELESEATRVIAPISDENTESDMDLDQFLPPEEAAPPAPAKKKKSGAAKIIIIILLIAAIPVVLLVLAVIAVIAFFLINYGVDDSINKVKDFGNGGSIVVTPEEDEQDHDASSDEHFYYGGTPGSSDYDEPEDTTEAETQPVIWETEAPETEAPETDALENEPPETEAYDDGRRVVIANGGLRLRNRPDLTSGAIVGLIPNGTIINVERFENNWAYTSVDGVYGWCSCDYLFIPLEFSGTALYVAKVTASAGVDIVSDEYVDADILHTLVPYGDTVYVYSIEGSRAYVSYNNIYGWCSTEYLDMESIY